MDKRLLTLLFVVSLLFSVAPALATETIGNNENCTNENDSVENTTLIINDFYSNCTNGTAPLRTNFISNVTGNPVSWNWSFSPIDLRDYYSLHPVTAKHTFMKVGNYDVTLTVKDAAGNVATLTKKDYIHVFAPGIPHNGSNNDANVNNTTNNTTCKTTIKSYSGYAPFTVKFSDATKNVYSRYWNFGDSKMTYKSKCVSHKYMKPGKYKVTLKVKTKNGKVTTKTVAYVTVKAKPKCKSK